MNQRDFNRKTKALQDLAERGKLVKAKRPIARDKNTNTRFKANLIEGAQKQWQRTDPSRVEKIKNSIKNRQADHLHDLQLKGADELNNLTMLDPKVNMSLGVQIKNALKDVEPGTKIVEIVVKK